MAVLQTFEDKLVTIFKDVPPLPESAKELLVKVWPWLALIGGILQLLAALALYKLATVADNIIDYSNSLSTAYGGVAVGPAGFDKTIIYLGVLLLAVNAVILLVAFPKLQKRAKSGWDLLFLAALLNLLYGVVQIFTYGRGIGSFIWSLITTALVFYLLFQIREKYNGKKVQSRTAPPITSNK